LSLALARTLACMLAHPFDRASLSLSSHLSSFPFLSLPYLSEQKRGARGEDELTKRLGDEAAPEQ
jgi:hypothetical protein